MEKDINKAKEPDGEIVDGKITLTFNVGDQWITKKEAQEMVDKAIKQVMASIQRIYKD